MDFSSYRADFAQVLESIDAQSVSTIVELLVKARQERRTVFVVGNGGSAANASHFCEDLAKGTVRDFNDQKRLRIMSLTDNTPGILAWANDEGFDSIFVEQLKTYASTGDLLLAISGSGNSPNILNAVTWANEHGIDTIGLTGYDGGQLRRIAKYGIHVPVDNMGAAEAAHDVVFHYVVDELCQRFAGPRQNDRSSADR